MQYFTDKKILLGICGGVAAYKAAYLVRELTRLGAKVRTVMTQSAVQFINPLLIQALSGNEVRMDLFDTQAERAMGHIELARWADCLLIAPASANCLAKLAHGIADDLLSTLYLVAEVPVVVCPAMNKSMWGHPATVANCALLKQRGVIFIGPEEGSQACGEWGFGRLSEEEHILNALFLLDVHQILVGKKVVITAGPTRESIDPVRYISNHSSGKMGYAMAAAAAMAGAEVTLISGPTQQVAPFGVKMVYTETAQSMYDAVMLHVQPESIFIGAAAVVDYAPRVCAAEKIKKKNIELLQLDLVKNPDILAAVAAEKRASYVVGFAAETSDVVKHATEKLEQKHLDMIIANQVGNGLGFDSDINQVTVITAQQHVELPSAHKVRLAGQIITLLANSIEKGRG